MTRNWLERKTLTRCGKYSTKKSIWENQHLFLIMYIWGVCSQRQCEISKDLVDQHRTMFESRISAGATENYHARKICVSLHGPMTWKVMWAILWVSKQDDSKTLYSNNSMLWRPSLQRRRIEIHGRIVKSMLSKFSEMLVFGTYWKTRYSIGHWTNLHDRSQMDQSLWQTPESIDFKHSSHKWLRGKHGSALSIGLIPRLGICWRLWGLKINLGEEEEW